MLIKLFFFQRPIERRSSSVCNRPFQTSSQPPFQSEAKCGDQFSFILKLELITITKITHLDSL